jgi:hypothetical protein
MGRDGMGWGGVGRDGVGRDGVGGKDEACAGRVRWLVIPMTIRIVSGTS